MILNIGFRSSRRLHQPTDDCYRQLNEIESHGFAQARKAEKVLELQPRRQRYQLVSMD